MLEIDLENYKKKRKDLFSPEYKEFLNLHTHAHKNFIKTTWFWLNLNSRTMSCSVGHPGLTTRTARYPGLGMRAVGYFRTVGTNKKRELQNCDCSFGSKAFAKPFPELQGDACPDLWFQSDPLRRIVAREPCNLLRRQHFAGVTGNTNY